MADKREREARLRDLTIDPDAVNPNGAHQPRVVSSPGDPYPNAKQFVADYYAHAERDLLVHHGGAFEKWNDCCWPQVDDRALRAALYEHFDGAVYVIMTPAGPELVEFRPTRNKITDVVDALKACVHLPKDITAPAWLDDAEGYPPASEMLALRNGLLHLPSRTLYSHSPLYYVNWALPYDFDQNAPTPTRWLQFLDDLWHDDEESKDTLAEIFGYMLSGDTRAQKLFMLVGPKRSGKGTIARVLGGLLGRANVVGPTLASLSQNFGLQSLIGKPVAVIADARLRSDDAAIVERLLSISGEDLMTVPRKYQEDWNGKLPTRFLLISNETPMLHDSSGALASRFVILQFVKSFYGHEDQGLTDALLLELAGILQWSLNGLARLRERGYFVQPKSALELQQELEDLGSPVKTFVRERCEVGGYKVDAATLFSAWQSWCSEQGETPGTSAAFGRDLHAAIPGLRRRQGGESVGRARFYEGIRLGSHQ